MYGWMYEWMGGWVYTYMSEWMNGLGFMDGWGGWNDECIAYLYMNVLWEFVFFNNTAWFISTFRTCWDCNS